MCVATYPNVRETILPGRFVSVEINMNEIKDALAIPSEAIIPKWVKIWCICISREAKTNRNNNRITNRKPCAGIGRFTTRRYTSCYKELCSCVPE